MMRGPARLRPRRSTEPARTTRPLAALVAFALAVMVGAGLLPVDASAGRGEGTLPVTAAAGAARSGADGLTGRLSVTFAPGMDARSRLSLARIAGFREDGARTASGWVSVEPAPGVDLFGLAERLEGHPFVERVRLGRRVYPALTPNDTYYDLQWALPKVDAEQAWDVVRGRMPTATVVVAVPDSGIDLGHPDLAPRLWTNPGETPGNGIDDDANDYVDDVYGWDFSEDDADPSADADGSGAQGDLAEYAHGTHVAGIVAARSDDAVGVSGIAGPDVDVELMAVRMLDGTYGGEDLVAAQAVEYAVDNGADIINASWAGYGKASDFEVIGDAIEYARDHGVLVVCAAGNSSSDNDPPYGEYPASFEYDNIISVAATTEQDALADFSNHGETSVDLGAPGVSIASAMPTDVSDGSGSYALGWGEMRGTSMAAPQVSGAAAVVEALYPGEWYGSTKLRLLLNALPVAGLAGKTVTGARLDPASAAATSGPDGEIVLEDGAEATNETSVSLTASVYGADEMRVDAGGGYGAWVDFEPSSEVTLTAGDGVKWVSARFRSAVGTATLSDSIVLDTTPPGPPGGVVAEPANRAARVTWEKPAPDVTSYEVSRKRTGGSFSVVGSTTSAEYADTSLTNDVTYLYRVRAVDRAGNVSDWSSEAAVTPSFRLLRLEGADRYATAVSVSREHFDRSDAVVVATGEAFPDALAASGLAGSYGAPILLTRSASLPEGVAAEIERLGAVHAFIVGGKAAVSEAVAEEIRGITGSVERVAGPDRYTTAVMIADRIVRHEGADPDEVFVVRGDDFPDALAVAPLAYALDSPVLLVTPDTIPPVVAGALDRLAIHKAYVAGGHGAVSPSVADSLGLPYVRLPGRDRYETAAVVSETGISNGWVSEGFVALATGAGFPDALGGGAAAGSRGGVLLLTAPQVLPGYSRDFLVEYGYGIDEVDVLGGVGAVGDDVFTEIGDLLD